MHNINFPIDFKFHIATLSNDFTATDSQNRTIAYTRQKLFKLKEHVIVYKDSSKKEPLYHIKAGSWLDFSASYHIKTDDGKSLGKVSRKGFKSLWKAQYHVIDALEQDSYTISEENPLTKFLDGIVGDLPIIGFFSGYILNPTYVAKDKSGNVVLRLKKNPSLFGRRFTLHKVNEFDEQDIGLLMLSFMMMLLLERDRG